MTPSKASNPWVLSDDIERLLIVGAGGFGREVLMWATDTWPESAHRIAGFLANHNHSAADHQPEKPIFGDPATFVPAAGDAFLLAIGVPFIRRTVAEALLSKGAAFLTLVHPTAIVAPNAALGAGSILCPYAVLSDSARIGRFTLLNYHSSLGHDAQTGDFCVLSPYAALGGNATVSDDVFLGMHASVGPGKRVGRRSKLSANSCALADVPDDRLVFGVPGRVAPRFNIS